MTVSNTGSAGLGATLRDSAEKLNVALSFPAQNNHDVFFTESLEIAERLKRLGCVGRKRIIIESDATQEASTILTGRSIRMEAWSNILSTLQSLGRFDT